MNKQQGYRISFGYQMLILIWFFVILPIALIGYYFYTSTSSFLNQKEQMTSVQMVNKSHSLINNLESNLGASLNEDTLLQPSINENIRNESFRKLPNVDVVGVVNSDGTDSTYKGSFDTLGIQYAELIPSLASQTIATGLWDTSHGLYIVAAKHVSGQGQTGNSNGILIFGQKLDQATLGQIQKPLQANLGFVTDTGKAVTTSSDLGQALKGTSFTQAESLIKSSNDSEKVYTPLTDINGKTIAVLCVESASDVTNSIIHQLRRTGIFVGCFVLLLLILIIFILNRRIIGPLNFFVKTLGSIASGDYAQSLPTDVEARAHPQILNAFERVRSFAYFDYLTGLPNRTQFHAFLERFTSNPSEDSQLALMFLDLDRFKYINDTLGHSIGDQLLREVGVRLNECIGPENFLARLGGDEFTVVLPSLEHKADANLLAVKMIDVLKNPFYIQEFELYITTSIGISFYPVDADTVEGLIRNADMAMYKAKSNSRNNYYVFSPELQNRTIDRLQLENDLHKAIERNELVLHYQPFYHVDTGEIVGVEALVRWIHPERGFISPGAFIPIAEETGLILSIGDWVVHEACRQNKLWQLQGLKPVFVAVNISALQFQHPGLIDIISHALNEVDLDAKWLEVEITESLMMDHVEDAIATLNQLKDIGIRISIDDFGTGYSSLAYLERFPLDTLKIDQSFVRSITDATNDSAIAKTIVNLGHNFNLTVVAEGVENESQLNYLRTVGCDISQGYLHSPPVSAEKLEPFLGTLLHL